MLSLTLTQYFMNFIITFLINGIFSKEFFKVVCFIYDLDKSKYINQWGSSEVILQVSTLFTYQITEHYQALYEDMNLLLPSLFLPDE